MCKLGYKMSEESRLKMSLAKKGRIPYNKGKICLQFTKENNPSWMGGISFEPYGIEFDRYLREEVRKRDNYTCQECNKSQEELKRKLTIHHIDYNKKNNKKINLISLCLKCHAKTNFNREHWKNYFNLRMFFKELFNPNKLIQYNMERS